MSRSSAAAAKLLGLVVVLVLIAIGPRSWIWLPPALFLGTAAVGGVKPKRFFRRLLPVFAFAGVMAAAAAWSKSGEGQRPIDAATRAAAAGCVLVSFGELTSLTEVFRGMRSLRVPALLSSALALMLRSIDVLAEERRALLRSRAARGGVRASRWAEWGDQAGLVGLVLARAVDRSERVHRAMKARGWTAERRDP